VFKIVFLILGKANTYFYFYFSVALLALRMISRQVFGKTLLFGSGFSDK